MKNRLVGLLVFALVAFNLYAQSDQSKKGLLTFTGTRIISFDPMREMPKMAWYSENQDIRVDEEVLFNNQSSLLIPSVRGKKTEAYFGMNNRDITGKTIVFKGKYKYQQANNAKVSFAIKLDTHLQRIDEKAIDFECNGSQDWKDFYVEMPFTRSKKFFFRILCDGEARLWVNDCQVLIDGQSLDLIKNPDVEVDKDLEFAGNSGISLGDVDGQTLENLVVLGKVWGFLKYFHPQVVVGKYNWDFELFRVMPGIAAAKSKKERNSLLNEWIDKYGKITETEEYVIGDSAQYHRFAQLGWLEDPNVFDKKLSEKLVRIKNAKRNSVLNYYLPILTGKEEVEFARDKPYPSIDWEDQGYRILTVYRLWNAIEHGYPYANLTDHRWSTLLAQYLPEFIYASSEKDLDHSIRKLAAEINDSHGGLEFPNHAPRLYGLPLGLTQTTDGKLVVESTALKQIERGSVILAVNDKPISEIIDNYRSILPSSNEHGLLRNVSFRLFVTSENEMKVTVENQGQSHEYTIPMQSFERASFKGRKSPSDYGLDARKILYVDAGIIGLPELDQMMKTNLNAKGMILDMRKYPRWDIMEVLGKYLYPQPTTFMWYSINSKKFPGNFGLDIIGKIGFKENPDYFKGKIAILVNEMTQSFGELMSVAYRVAPKSAVIGTQTAGANGHVGYLYLPRGIKFTYTMAGAFYPEWKLNQRDGVTIDIPVEQTVEDIAAGEDMWIRKAIEYIESKR